MEERGAFCKWWDKPMNQVSEHESERCGEENWNCQECPYFGEIGKDEGHG